MSPASGPASPHPVKRDGDWATILRGRNLRPAEWLAERGIFLVSLSAILVIFLIFMFVAREALPVAIERMTSSSVGEVIPVEQMEKVSPARLAKYLGVSESELTTLPAEVKRELMKVKIEEHQAAPKDRDAALNTARWRYLLLPHQWTDYEKPENIWQPVSQVPKYNIVPLIVGSLKATLVALLFSVPLALGAALYVSQLAHPQAKEYLKPGIEMLAGIPSVVLGFFALIVMATVLQKIFGYESRLNAFLAGIVLGLAIIPVVFSIAEDALTSVPSSYKHAALALGSSKWQCAWNIVLPAALPGVFAAIILGFGRAIGETMIVLMASGNASIVSWNLFDSTRTMTAMIAAELAETVFGGTHYRILFLVGALLFVVTFLSNLVSDVVLHRLKGRLEGRK
jgi:phosphate transport system permease protein